MKLALTIGVFSLVLLVLPNIAKTQDSDKNTDISTHMATGCLRKGVTANNFALTDEDGKTWELSSQSIPLRPHVGHTITVTGTIPTDPKNSSDAATQNRLLVSKVETVRTDCKQP
jgi:hypothetical protein